MSVFTKTGIYFLNPDIFREVYFIPAKVSITIIATTQIDEPGLGTARIGASPENNGYAPNRAVNSIGDVVIFKNFLSLPATNVGRFRKY
jgi:hypothetical protein